MFNELLLRAEHTLKNILKIFLQFMALKIRADKNNKFAQSK